jgi:hypothetical protein
MQEDINFTVINNKFKKKHVDGVEFDTYQLLRYLIHHFGLSEKAKHTSVEFVITVDGAQLDDHCGHVTIGFKIVDKDAIDPIRPSFFILRLPIFWLVVDPSNYWLISAHIYS